MLARIAVTVLLSIIVFIVVSLFVGLGVLWWTGDVARGALIGVISGTVFTVGTVGTANERSREHSGDDHERSRGGHDR
jgi:Na+/proline symporter